MLLVPRSVRERKARQQDQERLEQQPRSPTDALLAGLTRDDRGRPLSQARKLDAALEVLGIALEPVACNRSSSSFTTATTSSSARPATALLDSQREAARRIASGTGGKYAQLDEERAAIRIQCYERRRRRQTRQSSKSEHTPAWHEDKVRRRRLRMQAEREALKSKVADHQREAESHGVEGGRPSGAGGRLSAHVPTDERTGAPHLPHGRAPPKLLSGMESHVQLAVQQVHASGPSFGRRRGAKTSNWIANPHVSGAAERFDATHFDQLTRAAALEAVARGGRYADRPSAAVAFVASVRRVRATRFVRDDESVVPGGWISRPQTRQQRTSTESNGKKKKRFDPATSIWAPRIKWCDSKALLDTEQAALQRFDNDFGRMLDMKLGELVTRSDDSKGLDTDGDGRSDEIEEVETVLWNHHTMLFTLFTYYACMGGDLDSLGLNQFAQLLEDFHLVSNSSKYCKKADMVRVV